MSRAEVNSRRWLRIFVMVAALVLVQIGWWTTVFIRDVNTIASLRKEIAQLKGTPSDLVEIERTAFHRRIMFISEGVFLSSLTLFGLYLLFKSFQMQEKTREAQKKFIEMITHESKTPLTALKLRLESLREEGTDKDSLERELDLSLEEVRRLSGILEKVLHLNRMERHEVQFEPIALTAVVQEVLRRIDPVLKERNVSVRCELDADVLVKGDRYGLQTTVQSLLENAVLYNDRENKFLLVSVRHHGERAALFVEDNGPGILKEERHLIFEKFYRGRSGRRAPGTGLGLYLAKSIIDAHRGVIQLADLENGARFEIFLPMVSA